MALTDFLVDGKVPEGSALTATTSQNVLPDWYTNYAMETLANQNAISAQPYTPYQAPRIADFTQQQRQGFDLTQQAAGAYQPALTAATGATQAAMGAPGGLATAQPYYQRAAGMSGVTAAQPLMQQGAGMLGASTQTSGLSAAQPYLQQAGQSSVSNINTYMNPYTENVVNRIGELANRNLTENIMPGIEGRYIAAGQLGYGPQGGAAGTPSGMMTDTARAIRDTQEATLAEQLKALQAGYSEAAGLASSDLARQAQLASTAGGLGTAQQQALLSAGTNLANIGQNLGQLTAADREALAAMGTSAGNLAGSDVTRQLAGAAQLADMGGLAQKYGLTGAEAVTGVGAQQQALNQKNLDVAYSDFLKQQGYPQEQIDAALKTLQGVSGAVPKATTTEGIAPLGYQPETGPSTGETIGGILAALLAGAAR